MKLRALVTRIGTSFWIGCCTAILVSGCGHGTTIIKKKSAAPTPPPIDVNALIIGVDEVGRIAGVEGLSPAPPKHEPSHFPKPGAPQSCQPPYQDDLSFGTGWTQYRSEAYAASTSPGPGQASVMADILQAVAVYKDAGAARAEFDRVDGLLKACAALHDPSYDYAANKPDDATLDGSAGSVAFSYRVKATVLVKVAALGLPDPEQVTAEVLQHITDRIS
jgi:hypothetical protein